MNRILLIEDDAGAQLLYRNRLTDLGYEVVVSGTGAMGLVEARAAAFDLYLVDIELGSGIDGYEVCRRLKTIPEIHSVPVVLISGRVKSQEDLHRGYAAGCQSFLVKGDLMLLEDIVRAMLRIKSLQDDLALQNRLLEDRNRRFAAEQAPDAEASSGRKGAAGPSRPAGMLLVDGEGVVCASDRGARDLFGQVIDGKHLALLAPDSRLEADVRNARTEPHEAIRFEAPERNGRLARQLLASVHPFVPEPGRARPPLRLVQLHEVGRPRTSADATRRDASPAFRREWALLMEAARESHRPSSMLGTSAAMRELRAGLARLATEDEPVLLCGPEGSGRTLAARILHYSGTRSGPFVALSCAAFAADALANELFGGGPAASSGESAGALQQAQGGTLFLQDVERLPPSIQARLLEVLSSGRVRPAASAERLDVRLLSGTRIDLEEAVAQGQFLGELARRLASRTLRFPALKERTEDIELLSRHFLARHARFDGAHFSAAASWLFAHHDWPGNVRELESSVQDACAAAGGAEVGVEDLPRPLHELQRRLDQRGLRPPAAAASAAAPSEPDSGARLDQLEATGSLLAAYEKQALLHALRLKRGDKLAAARLLEVGKSTFYRKLKQYGIT